MSVWPKFFKNEMFSTKFILIFLIFFEFVGRRARRSLSNIQYGCEYGTGTVKVAVKLRVKQPEQTSSEDYDVGYAA